MPMLWDTHMHTDFSGDSDSPMESMILSAINKKLPGICFTDHCDLDYPNTPDLFLLDLASYTTSVSSFKKKYLNQIDIRYGIELGLQTHLATQHATLLAAHDFDFVIGSSHLVDGIDPYYPKFYEGRTEREAYRNYFESILENINSFDDFDVYGHIDYVVRYGPTKNKHYNWLDYKDILDLILTTLIEKGKGIELNTGGFKYGLGHPNPCEDIICRYKELGGEIITIGADAHKPEHIAFDFSKVPDILKSCGFDYYTVFSNRKPNFIKL